MSSKLRKKFSDHMEFHGLAHHTKRGYIAAMRGLAGHYNLSPDRLTDEQVRAYFRHLLLERKLAWTSCKNYLSGKLNRINFYKI